MPIIVKMNDDKSLRVTKITNVYQYENNADDFLILLPEYYEDINLKECTVTFNWKNINGEGNSTYLAFGDGLYKETYIQSTVPVTILQTSVVGNIEIWLSITNPFNQLVMKTGSAFVDIHSTNDIDSEITEQDLLILDDYLLQIQQLKEEVNLKLQTARFKSEPITQDDLDANLQQIINNLDPPDIGDGNYVIIQGASIDDATPSFSKVYSSQTTENKISNAVTSAIGGLTGFSDENFTLEEKEKLATVEPNANYFELTEVDANIVVENTEKNFVSVTEKTTYADKYTKAEIDNLLSSIANGLIWKDGTNVKTFADITVKYPDPEEGWCVNTENEGTWLYNGEIWIKINNDKIPLSTEEINGLMTWVDKKKLNGIEYGANKYTHPLYHSADMILTNSTRNFVTSAQLDIINNVSTTIANALSNYRLKSTKILETDLDAALLGKIETGGSSGVINDAVTSISQTYSSFMINSKINTVENNLSEDITEISSGLQEIYNNATTTEEVDTFFDQYM